MATYYTSSSAAGGGSGALGDEWTLQEAFDSAVAGDIVLVKADGTYLPSARIDLDTNSGTDLNYIVFKGCASDGTDDGTVSTISGANLPATTTLLYSNSDYMMFQNLRITSATNYGFDGRALSGRVMWYNCRIDNCSNSGVLNVDGHTFYYCEFDHNGSRGAFAGTGFCWFNYCSFHDNGDDGVIMDDGCLLNHCLIYDNAGEGVYLYNESSSTIINCVIHGNTDNGIHAINSGGHMIMHNIIMNNGAYGINYGGSTLAKTGYADYNCYYNNTSGATTLGSPLGSNNLTEDPNFVSVADGAEDFTPQNTNLLKTFAFSTASGVGGTSYEYIGAIQPQGGSGGGLLRPPGMTGGILG